MTVSRRQFLKGVVYTGAAASAAPTDEACAALLREPMELPPKAVGMLYDSTLCIGCRACVGACKEANGMPVEMPSGLNDWNDQTWEAAEDLSGRTLNVIKVYRDGAAEHKDRETNGYAFVKRHCLHCIDPSCVSVCPVSAMKKDAETGIVTHDPDACIGCRYCVYGCPFGVPQYDLNNPFGKIQKCQFCNHLQKVGKTPACCDVCPTGATLFGKVVDLQAEAERRLAMKPGSTYAFPRGDLAQDRPRHEGTIPTYYKNAVYGVDEGGGVQVRYLSAVPFEKIGLPDLEKTSFAQISEGIQHTLYKGMIAPLALLAGLALFAWRSTRKHHDTET